MRMILLIAVVLLGIDALYYDGAHTQAGQREISAAVASLVATMGDEFDRTAERQPTPSRPVTEPETGG